MKITLAYYLVLVNLLGAEASKDFKVQLERGKHSVSATAHTDAIRQKRRLLKENAKNMKENKDLKHMSYHNLNRQAEDVENLGAYKDPLYKRVIDYFSP